MASRGEGGETAQHIFRATGFPDALCPHARGFICFLSFDGLSPGFISIRNCLLRGSGWPGRHFEWARDGHGLLGEGGDERCSPLSCLRVLGSL